MALTTNQLIVGMFNAAAGGYKTNISTYISNMGVSGVESAASVLLSQSPLGATFLGQSLYSTNASFSAAVVSSLLPGLTASTTASVNAAVTDFWALNPTLTRSQLVVKLIEAVVAIPATDALLGGAAGSFKAKVALADAYTGTSTDLAVLSTVIGATPAAVTTFSLTTGVDNLVGSSGDDTFTARIMDNANTAQSGDKIDGGAGNDYLTADIGNSQKFAITLETTGVESVAIRAQAVASDTSNNNLQSSISPLSGSQVQIDAQRMVGVTTWESNNSRADLVIEDVRIANNAATKTVTIAMVETDPGNVDMGVYFNQNSLRNSSSGTAAINIFLMDTASAGAVATAATPLLNQYFNTYTFYSDNVLVTLGGAGTAAGLAIDAAQTYEQLQAAFQLALKTANVGGVVSDLSAGVAVTLSGPVNMTTEAAKSSISAVVANSFLNLTGQVLTLTAASAGTTSITSTSTTPGAPNGGWAASGTAPSTGAIVQTFNTGTTSSAELVTSKVILDDVGMGSTGGDLVIGGMSVGETSTSRGVERFEIEVRDNSKLQTINGTNNALREVTIVNGVTSSSSSTNAYTTTTTNAGDLTVNGNVNLTSTGTGTAAGTGSDTILKGVNNANGINGYTADHHGAFGFTDVRLIDASAMTGKLAFTAQITSDSIAKYVTAVDTAANPAGDVANAGNANFNVKGANFAYTGGSNNDTMVVAIDGAAAASRSNVVSGQSDFTFNVNGGAGNDTITVSVINGTQKGSAQNWYNNQDLNNNITINGGSGNDTIKTPGAGDVIINAGEGNDLVYTDNTGTKGQWVFNTSDQVTALAAARSIADLRSDTNESYNFYNSKLVVTFKGLPSVSILVNGTGYKTTDLEINQAIKNAINTDPTLKALLVATDGPANSLVVTSLIDGVMAPTDLTVGLTTLTLAEVTALPANELALAGAAYGIAAGTVTAATVFAAMTLSTTAYATNGDYVTAMTNDGAANVVGSNSTSTSDNLITPGAGNDVIVLGTTVSAVAADLAGSSNETIVFGAGFGNDVIVNFAVAGNGVDHLDFSGIKGTTLVAAGNFTTDKSINIAANTTLATSTTITEKMAIETLFNANNIVAQDHVFVSVNAHNVGNVYSVTDAIGATNAVATLEGSIDLANTAWASLLGTTFVNSAAANYFLTEGPTAIPAVVTPVFSVAGAAAALEGTSATYTVSLSAAQTVATTVSYTLAGTGGATAADLVAGTALTGTLTFAPGTTSLAVLVPFAVDANTPEAGEAMSLTLSAPSAGTTLATAVASASITDVAPVGPVNVTIPVAAANVSFDAAINNNAFVVALGTYTYSIANFGALDSLAFPAGVAASVNNPSFTDGIVDLTYASGGQVVTIQLTGVSAANDGLLNSVADFNTVFGAGTIV